MAREDALEGALPPGELTPKDAPLGQASASQATALAENHASTETAAQRATPGHQAREQTPPEGRHQIDPDFEEPNSSEEAPIDGPFPIRPQTELSYRKSLKTMTRYSEALRREEPDETEAVPVTLTDVVRDFLARDDLAPSTSKNYRASLLWHARCVASGPGSESLRKEARSLIPILEEERNEPGRPREADYQQLVAELQRAAIAGSLWSSRAGAWLMAGVLTGVRPGEWTSARWSEHNPLDLVVTTGKAKLCEPAFVRKQVSREQAERQGLAFGLDTPFERTIPLEREFDQEVVDNHLRYLVSWLTTWKDQQNTRRPGRPSKKEMAAAQAVPLEQLTEAEIEEAYAAYYDGVRSAMRQACLRLWNGEKMYSLYSARGQFSANARAEHGPGRTSELMGHTSPDSPTAAHYGKQRSAHGRYRGLGAERIRRDGSAMPEEAREHLQQRRLGGAGEQPDSFDDAEI